MAGEMAVWVKCLLRKREDLSSDPQAHLRLEAVVCVQTQHSYGKVGCEVTGGSQLARGWE